jgi:hypothetical protein
VKYVSSKLSRIKGIGGYVNAPGSVLTVAVVVKIQQLVAPLGDDPEPIFKKSDDDQESSDGREVSTAMRRQVSCLTPPPT